MRTKSLHRILRRIAPVVFLALTTMLSSTHLFSADTTGNASGVTCEIFHVITSIYTGTATTPTIRERFEYVDKTPNIPLIKGHGLAVFFTLDAPYSSLETVRLVVNHPEMKSPDGETSPQVDRTQATMLVDGARTVSYSYTFDEDWELVAGKWSVEIFTGGKRIGSAKAFTYDPDTIKFPAFTPRLITLATKRAATDDDRQFLEKLSKQETAEAFAATALLYRLWPEKYQNQFVQCFRIAPDAPQKVLPEKQINDRVNAIMHLYADRHPIEISALIYAGFRKSGYAAQRSDGSKMSLETMFRGALFTGILPDQNINAVHRLAAAADGKTLPPELAQ